MITDTSADVSLKSSLSVSTVNKTYNYSTGDTVTYDDLFKLILMQNSNEATTALVRVLSGTTAEFVAKMNEKAKQLGMNDTLYANVTGVDYVGQYTTASDVGTLLKHFYSVNYLASTSANSYTSLSSHFDSSRIYSRNFFYSSYYNSGASHIDSSVIAGTSTYTSNALHCTTAVKEYKGKLYMCVMLAGSVNSSNYSVNYDEIPNAVKWGGDSFDYISVLNKWTPVAELSVEHGLGFDHATVFCKNNVFFYTLKNVDPKTDIKYEYDLTYDSLTAPVEEGMVVGKAMAYYDGELVATEDLIIVNSIALNESSVAAKNVKTFLSGKKFITGCIIFALCFVIYVLSAAAYRGHKQRKRLQNTEKQ